MMTARTRRCLALGCALAGTLGVGAASFAAVPVSAQSATVADAAGLDIALRVLAEGDVSRALQLATAYLDRHPGDLRAQLLVTRAHIAAGNWDAAYRVVSAAARDKPEAVEVHYYLGLVTRRLASDQFERLASIAPTSGRLHQLQAEVFEAQERREDAEREYAAALAAEPDLLEALLGLGKLQRIRLACDEAIAHYRRAEQLRPTFDAAYGLGVCHAQAQDDAQAVKDFAQAVERSPSAGVAWAWLGTSLVKLGRVTEGIETLERAVALEPTMSEAYYVLGMAYRTSGDTGRARAAFAKVEALRSRPPH